MSRIEVDIGEMVLEGVAPPERHRFAEAFRAELERLFRERGSEPPNAPGCPGAFEAARSVYEEVMRCLPEAAGGPFEGPCQL